MYLVLHLTKYLKKKKEKKKEKGEQKKTINVPFVKQLLTHLTKHGMVRCSVLLNKKRFYNTFLNKINAEIPSQKIFREKGSFE
jgi:hypothetical protein